MSITNTIDPTGFVSIQDSLWHIVTSDNSGQVNFKYVFDIYNQDEQLIRVKTYPEPSNGKGYFDAGNVVRNLIKYDWFEVENLVTIGAVDVKNPFVKSLDTSGQIAATYNIRYGEEYNASGVTTTTLNMVSGNITAYNYLPKLFGRKKFTIDAKNRQFLTNRPLRATFDRNKDTHLYVPIASEYQDTNTPPEFVITIYNVNNSTIYSELFTSTLSTGNWLYQLDIGVNAIEGAIRILSNDENDVFPSNAAWYQIGYADQLFRVYLLCSPNENVSLHFINAYGLFDTAIFRGANKLNMNVERKAYEKNDYIFTNSNVDYFNQDNIYYESKVNYSQNINHTYRLTYEYPNDAEYAWLAELIYSPLIYMEKDGNFYPVTIKNTNYQYNQVQYDRLNNLEIEIEINQKRKGYLR